MFPPILTAISEPSVISTSLGEDRNICVAEIVLPVTNTTHHGDLPQSADPAQTPHLILNKFNIIKRGGGMVSFLSYA